MAHKLTRKESKERTRQALLDGLLDVARNEGLQGLTTTKIADAAGVAQSSFYFHFDGMDDAMQAAADRLGRQIRDAIRAERKNIDLSDARRTLRSVYAVTINAFLAEPAFAQLFLRHRRDSTSPLGQKFGELLDESRQELAEDMKKYLAGLPHPEVYAELFVGMSMSMLEGLIDGRLTDREACLDALGHVVGAALASAPRL
jgi:AcrR family transcriptional regulator